MNDDELIAKILSRDRKALYTFYRTYQPRLSRFIRTKIDNDRDAEEVLQDTLYSFLEALRDFEGKAHVETFLFSICNHKIIDYYRRKKIRHLVFSQVPQLECLVSPLLGPEDEYEGTVLREKLACAFAELVPKYRSILQSKYMQDKSVDEIAVDLELTMKAAESLLFRARKAFVKAFARL